MEESRGVRVEEVRTEVEKEGGGRRVEAEERAVTGRGAVRGRVAVAVVVVRGMDS